MEFDIFYYENDISTIKNKKNPRIILSNPSVLRVLSDIINQTPNSIDINQYSNNEITNSLLMIDAIKLCNNKLSLNIPIFIERDLPILKKYISLASKKIYHSIEQQTDSLINTIHQIQNGFSDQVNLYHMLCGYVFDGTIFDELAKYNLITTHKVHPDYSDYLIIMYEKNNSLNTYSNKLLCSYNRLQTSHGTFSSFGDCDGNRNDFYRQFMLQKTQQLDTTFKYSPDELGSAFHSLILGNTVSDDIIGIFTEFGYVKDRKINVPVYSHNDFKVGDEISKIVIDSCSQTLTECLNLLSKEHNLLSIQHNVDIRDIANEIYHLIFGTVNELLVQHNIVAQPEYHPNEGRYLKSYEI